MCDLYDVLNCGLMNQWKVQTRKTLLQKHRFLLCFPGVAKLGDMFRKQYLCPENKTVFDFRQKKQVFVS